MAESTVYGQEPKIDKATLAVMEQFNELGFRCSNPSDNPNYYWNNLDGSINDIILIGNINEASDVRIAKLPVFPRPFSMQLKTDKLSAEGFAELERQKHMRRLELSGEKKLDPFLPVLENLDSVKALSLNNRLITPAILRAIAKMPSIDELQIFENAEMKSKPIFDIPGNIQAIAKMKRIRTLGLSGTSVHAFLLGKIADNRYTSLILQDCKLVDEHCINSFHKIKTLKTLWLSGTIINDEAVIHLATGGKLQLEELAIGETPVTDKCLKFLKTMKSLKVLVANETKISDVGLKDLKEMTQLVHLDLQSTKITGTGIAELKELTNLIYLQLAGNAIDDSCVESLLAMKKLQYLGLG